MRRITQALMQMQHRGRDAWIREKQFQLVTHMQRSWRREMIDARMYQALAVRERIAFRQSVLLALASAAERRAARWATRLRRRGVRLPTNNAPRSGKHSDVGGRCGSGAHIHSTGSNGAASSMKPGMCTTT